MERKTGGSVQVVADEVKTSLAKGPQLLAGEEERALRMRHGVSVDRKAPLARAAGGNAELEDELLVIEMQLMKAMRARTGQTRTASNTKPAAAAAQRVSATAVNQTKDKIVRALRKKK